MGRNTSRAADGGRRGSSGKGIDATEKEKKKPNPLVALVDKLGLDKPTLTTMFK
jgi:hypothetical protein